MVPEKITGQRILIAPLNWGLGHASRCYPLIEKLAKTNEVELASDGDALSWLREEFPNTMTHSLPPFIMTYSKKYGAGWGMVKKLPHFIRSIQSDYKAIKTLQAKRNYDVIISDNRYGVYHENTTSYLISHQLRLHHPLGKLFNLPFKNYLEKFTAIWVPDDERRSLSGVLSQPFEPLSIPLFFIGPLTRFTTNSTAKIHFKFLSIISGPEPFKSKINKTLHGVFLDREEPCAMVCGTFNTSSDLKDSKVEQYAHLNTLDLQTIIDQSETIICRSGYSSIMDFWRMDKNVIMLPTPGQSEQIYLARRHHNRGRFKAADTRQAFLSLIK